jgi:hypothetical protein
MKYLKELIEQVKRQPNIPVLVKGDDGKARPYKDGMKTSIFWDVVGDIVPFVFSRGPDPTTEAPEVDFNELLDCPFKTFSIEMLGDVPLSEARLDDPMQARVFCIVVQEYTASNGTTQYILFSLIKTVTNPISGPGGLFVAISTYTMPLVKAYLEKLNTGEVGTEHSRERLKVGTGKTKRTITIRKIVHVKPKGKKYFGEYAGTRDVDWTHRWFVRGHWRKHEGLGKDREGNYCIAGRTWVNAHEKGPEDAPLISKTRIVENKE